MILCLVVNNVFTELADYTTTLLALNAVNMGHKVWYIGLDKLSYGTDGLIYAKARSVSGQKYASLKTFVQALQNNKAIEMCIPISTLDILWLRNDPAEDVFKRPWARLAGVNFARFAMLQGVLVLNDPDGLSRAINKMYLQNFPKEVRPSAIISREPNDIKHFISQENGFAVLKPLAGSGGHNVFLIQPGEKLILTKLSKLYHVKVISLPRNTCIKRLMAILVCFCSMENLFVIRIKLRLYTVFEDVMNETCAVIFLPELVQFKLM